MIKKAAGTTAGDDAAGLAMMPPGRHSGRCGHVPLPPSKAPGTCGLASVLRLAAPLQQALSAEQGRSIGTAHDATQLSAGQRLAATG